MTAGPLRHHGTEIVRLEDPTQKFFLVDTTRAIDVNFLRQEKWLLSFVGKVEVPKGCNIYVERMKEIQQTPH